jgi:condensin complex subunit 1
MNVHADKTNEVYHRLEGNDRKVTNVLNMFRKYFITLETECFDEICSKTFQYIYSMCHLPNVISQELIQGLWTEMVEISDLYDEAHPGTDLAPEENGVILSQAVLPTQAPDDDKGFMIFPAQHLSRFVFMIGYVAMKELIYLDVDIFSNLKYRQDLTDAQKSTKKNSQSELRPSMNVSSAMAVKRRSEMPGMDEEENEEDVVGQSNDDVIIEQINAIIESEMLFHKESVFKQFIPLIVEILKHPTKYNQPELQRSALLALIHLMSVSSQFCETNMQFLMNIFSHAQDIDIKCNVIIGLSDLTFRFPNVIEPWSCHLYSTLYDENRELRLTTVRILAHLISHEMILVKGQISDLAMCIVDPDDEIKKTTEVFFKEIANKSNILYNVLPDIISRLSDPKLKLEEGKYQIIMKYIMGLISKDRQVEGLVEKLCFRFKVTEQERQWRDIAYCLSLLSYTEKTIKKLTGNITLFKDKVQVQEVYDYFRRIISNTLKLAKPELKVS